VSLKSHKKAIWKAGTCWPENGARSEEGSQKAEEKAKHETGVTATMFSTRSGYVVAISYFNP